jgi:hypothetical protein
MPLPEHVQTEKKEFVRETRSGALLSTNRAGLMRNRLRRHQLHEQRQTVQEVHNMRELIIKLEKQVTDLTTLIETTVARVTQREA